MTGLHFSAGYCHARATALLLHAGADEGAVDRNGDTPLDVVDTKRSPQVRHGVGRRRVRRMLLQGPAYRALSWRWPASPALGTPDSAAAAAATGSAALALPAGLDAAEPGSSRNAAQVVTLAAGPGSAKNAARLVPDPETEKEWVDSDESFDEAFASAMAGSWRLNVAVFRRSRPPPPSCGRYGGSSLVEQRAALVSRFERCVCLSRVSSLMRGGGRGKRNGECVGRGVKLGQRGKEASSGCCGCGAGELVPPSVCCFQLQGCPRSPKCRSVAPFFEEVPQQKVVESGASVLL